MVVKSNTANATEAAARRLDRVIESHRSYFSDWRSDRFDRSSDDENTTQRQSKYEAGMKEAEN